MKSFRFLIFAILAGFTAAAVQAAPVINASGISVSPSSAKPADLVTLAVSATNSAPATAAPANQNDFPAGGSANVTVTFTHMVTGYSFSLTGTVSTTAAIPENGGAGTLNGTFSLPTKTLQAGPYTATVVINSVSSGVIGASTFGVSTAALTVVAKPDFKITSVSYPAGTAYKGGDVIPMTLTFTNLTASNGVFNAPYVPALNNDGLTFRVEIILSSNPKFGDADDFLLTAFDIGSGSLTTLTGNGGSSVFNADGLDRTLTWNQILPGNFAGSYYVMAKIDTLNSVSETIDDDLSLNGNNTWFSPDTNAARIALLATNFPTVYWASNASNGYNDNPSISSDGRYTAFVSDATNLVTGDSNGMRDIFVYDAQTATIRRLNLSQQGAQANAHSQNPAISGDGRYVAFSSDATNVVLGDVNGFSDIFVADRITGTITLDSVSSAGVQANGSNFKPALSQDGRYLVFESSATNLVTPNTAVGVTNIYLRDRQTNTTTLISQSSTSVAGNGNSLQATISADGRYVVFASDATNLVASDTNGARDIFLRDLTLGTTIRISVASDGTQANGPSRAPSINRNTGDAADGRYVAFGSEASNLVAGDTNGVSDIFVYDRVKATTTRVSVSSAGVQGTDPSAIGAQLGSINPSISATGRYVAFSSLDSNLTAGDVVGRASATDANTSLDIFVADRDVGATGTFDTPGNIQTTMASVNRFGYQTNTLLGVPSTAASDIYPVISGDGRWVAFPTDAENTAGLVHGVTNRTSPDTNLSRDVILFDRRINALPGSGNPPTVTITNPGNGSTSLVNTPITVTASATASVGVIASVQFYVNGTSLGTSTTFPYSATWTPTAVGTYTLSALATDIFGNQAVSSNISVTINAAPSVGIVSPIPNATIVVGTTQTVTATAAATTPGATISKVQFFANGASLGTINSAPYSVTWTPATAGSVSLTAIATDSNGTQTTSPAVVVTVTNGPTTPPSVSITAPASGSSLSVNAPHTITASATAVNGNITSVQFFANNVSIGTTTTYPYSTTWTPTSLGTYALTATATDNNGATVTSSANAISVIDPSPSGPTVSVTNPIAGTSVVVGTPQQLAVNAADAVGIISVQFFVNGQTLGGPVTTYPFTTIWTPTTPGIYTISAQATNSTGHQVTSANVAITATAASPSLPFVYLTSTPTNTKVTVDTSVFVSATAGDPDGAVQTVGFYANGKLIATTTTAPYATTWVPNAPGTYSITAIATDNAGNQAVADPAILTALPQVGSVPVTALSFNDPSVDTPTTGAATTTDPTKPVKVTYGSKLILRAAAVDQDGSISNVQFFVNGKSIGTISTAPFFTIYQLSTLADVVITAIVTDSSGNAVYTNPIVIQTIASTSAASGVVTLISPPDGATYVVGGQIIFSATHNFGSVEPPKIDFYLNGSQFTTVTGSAGGALSTPYQYTIGLTRPGTYIVHAVARVGNTTTISSPSTITVIGNAPPTVTITSPASGSWSVIGSSRTLAATAADSDGTVDSVQFFVNGTALGSAIKTFPYQTQWNPGAEGVYRITATATDNAGASATSQTVTVLVIGSSKSSDTVYSGNYSGVGESGRVAAITIGGKTAALIGFSTSNPGRVYYYPGMTLDAGGGFTAMDTAGHTLVFGTASDSGVSGTLDSNRLTFIAPATFTNGSTVASGDYNGNLTGKPASTLDAIVGLDGSIFVYIADGTFRDAGAGTVSSTGDFTIVTPAGNKITGKADPLTGFLTGTLHPATGSDSSFTAAVASGVSFSDGFLRNLSTRGQVGTDVNVLIAGFVVAGTTPKQVLVRAIGPSLSTFGVTGLLADPQLQLFDSKGVQLAANNDWGGITSLATASASVGAFALPPASKDAVIATSLAPGSYTAQVSGVNKTTGVALVEIYDLDNPAPFSPQKVMNVSTRGLVGTGQAQLIAGFVVSGNTPKKVLIRAVGPTLGGAPFNIAGALADPVLKLLKGDTVVRENDNWEQGNDGALVSAAATKVGAFSLGSGSKDAAILINLPPGAYTAQATGSNSTTGVALVEVYEVP
jgi:Tol biopolymer transport system component